MHPPNWPATCPVGTLLETPPPLSELEVLRRPWSGGCTGFRVRKHCLQTRHSDTTGQDPVNVISRSLYRTATPVWIRLVYRMGNPLYWMAARRVSMMENLAPSLSSINLENPDAMPAGDGYYLTKLSLKCVPGDPTPPSTLSDTVSIVISSFDNGARRTEQFELKKTVEGSWGSAAAYRFNPMSPSVSFQFGPSGRLGGVSLPVAQLKSGIGGSIDRTLSLSVSGNTRQGARFRFSCDVATSNLPSPPVTVDPLQHLHDHATACFSRFERTKNVQELKNATNSLNKVTEEARTSDPRLLVWYNELSVYTLLTFRDVMDINLLQDSFSHAQSALGTAAQPPADVIRALQNNISVVLMVLFQATGFEELQYIEESIRLLKLASRHPGCRLPSHLFLLTMQETPLRTVPHALSGVTNLTAFYLDNLYYAFLYKFSQSDDPSDLREAARIQTEAVAATNPNDTPSLFVSRIHRLGTTLIRQVKYFNLVEFLDDAIEALLKAVSLTPEDDSFLPYRLADLVDALVTRFTLKEDLEDIEMAVTYQRKALELTPEDAPSVQLATWWDLLGSCYYYRYDRAGDVEDLGRSIEAHQKSVALTEEGDPALLVRLSNLGVPFMSRFEYLGDLDDITQAVNLQKRAVDLTSADDPKLPTRLNNLGLSLMQRYHHTDEEDDLKQAIAHQQRGIALTLPDDPELSTRLHNLVISLDFQLDLNDNLEDLDVAIDTEERAISLVSEDNPNLPTWLNNLGSLLNRRADSAEAPNDLERAISVHAQAVDVTPVDHPDLPIWWSNLGLAYRNKFVHTGDIEALQESIAVLQKSVKMTPPDHADLPGWLNNLSSALNCRFDYTGDREDLEEAIEVAREALKIAPEHRTLLRGTTLHNLGTNLYVYFTRFLGDKVLEESIRCLQEAVSLHPEGHAELPAAMRALADAQLLHFEHFAVVESLQAAIENLEKVVDLTTDGQIMRRANLAALGLALGNRFELLGDSSDWERAIKFHLRSIELTPEDHPDITLRYNSLGFSYLARHRRLSQEGDLKDAVAAFRAAATYAVGTWMARLMAAKEWTKYAPSISPYEALDAYKTSVELVSLAANLRFTIQRRHQHLLETADISRSAAAVALSVGKVEQALEWLEQGRGLVWSQLSQLRAPIEALQAHDHKLAERFIAVSKELESAGSQLADPSGSLDEKMVLQKRTGEQGKRAKEWEELLTTIRSIPSFEHFLLPPQTTDLLSQLPNSGYAVVINVHPDRCDAIVLSRELPDGHLLHVPLQSFSFKKAGTLYGFLRTNLAEAGVLIRGDVLHLDHTAGNEDNEILTGQGGKEGEGTDVRPAETDEDVEGGTGRGVKTFRRAGSARGSSTEQVLHELWTLVVEPIVRALGLTKSTSPMTRIWWCTTGVLSFLPIHAAGVYRAAEATALSDYAVSSYIPTVAMLAERSIRPTSNGSPGLLLVSQPDVPGMSRIPGTIIETEMIQKRADLVGVRSYRIDQDEEAKPEALMNSMQEYSCIHLACHASQSIREPLASGFYLTGGQLRLSTIIQARLTSADVAFLSACQTSTGNEDLSEEAVHLAAGMMAAGYRGVVAAMWSIQDRHGPQVADDFYGDLFARSAAQGVDGSKAAYSLHHSVQRLRKQIGVSELAFLAWVPYVHFGL